jgi:hypothetical protein
MSCSMLAVYCRLSKEQVMFRSTIQYDVKIYSSQALINFVILPLTVMYQGRLQETIMCLLSTKAAYMVWQGGWRLVLG